MRHALMIQLIMVTLMLTACNKSSPPPQKPLTPRTAAAIELPLHIP